MANNAAPTKVIDLALQGGGSHGALTWGVLDRFLDEDRLNVAAISGTSAGAMNAVVALDGSQRGGRAGARVALDTFWREISEAARFSPIQRTLWNRLTGNFSLEDSPSYHWYETITRLFSPYQLNPLDLNPLRDTLAGLINFERVNACAHIKAFVTATNVRTGRAKVFTQPNLTIDAVMASACLPFMFKAVEINGEAYWDGGYTGNPALYPLAADPGSRDLVVVQINPLVRKELPTTGRAILNRINEITFNSSLIKELRTLDILHQIIEVEKLALKTYCSLRIHHVHCHEEIQHLDASSKLNAEWEYLLYLKERGRKWADDFLNEHFDDIGVRSTFDVNELFTDAIRVPGIQASASSSSAAE